MNWRARNRLIAVVAGTLMAGPLFTLGATDAAATTDSPGV